MFYVFIGVSWEIIYIYIVMKGEEKGERMYVDVGVAVCVKEREKEGERGRIRRKDI